MSEVIGYHGTEKSFDKFDLRNAKEFGFHFGLTRDQAEHRNSRHIIKARIKYKHPVEMPDLMRWSFESISQALHIDSETTRRFSKEALQNAKSKSTSLREEMNIATADLLDALGYDAITYDNKGEGTGRAIIIWHNSQIVNSSLEASSENNHIEMLETFVKFVIQSTHER